MNAFIAIFPILFTILVSNSLSLPLEDIPLPPTKPEPTESLRAAPIRKVSCSTQNANHIGATSGTPEERYRWRKGFSVHPDPKFTKAEMKLINAAMYDLNQVLCVGVKVWPQKSKPKGDYAFIKRDDSNGGCYSAVGRQGGKQVINLGVDGCIYKGTIIHESIHALGFDHEQNRPDRDDYVDVFPENIESGQEHNFEKAERSLTFDVPYDYKSIMHYFSKAFSKNGDPTILAKNGDEIGWNEEITEYDAQKLKKMYDCE